jgi:hypothetical protein
LPQKQSTALFLKDFYLNPHYDEECMHRDWQQLRELALEDFARRRQFLLGEQEFQAES